jgi:hypothetical protein
VSRFAPQTPTDGPEAPITDGSSDGTSDELEPLQVPENCRFCLSQLALYESGMTACEAAARAIAKRVCLTDLVVSTSLIHQVRAHHFRRQHNVYYARCIARDLTRCVLR